MPFEDEKTELRIDRWQLCQLRAQKDDLDIEIEACETLQNNDGEDLADLLDRRDALETAIGALERLIERGRAALQELRLDQNQSRIAQIGLRALARVVTISSMGTVAISPLAPTLSAVDRKAALAAIAKGKRFKFVGIRPRGLSQPGVVLVAPTSHEQEIMTELGVAIGKAQIGWPGHLEYEVLGANTLRERVPGDAIPRAAAGMIFDFEATVLGAFDVRETTTQAAGS